MFTATLKDKVIKNKSVLIEHTVSCLPRNPHKLCKGRPFA